MKKIPTVVFCGIAAITATVLLYFALLSNSVLKAIHIIGLVAIIVSEIITTGYACFINKSPRRLAATIISGLMIPLSVSLTVVYVLNYPEGYITYLCLFAVGQLVVNTISFLLVRFSSTKEFENSQIKAAKDNMLHLRKLVRSVMAEPAATPFKDRLREIEEKLQFSNDSVICADDELLRGALLDLLESVNDPEIAIEDSLDKIEGIIRKRQHKV